MLHQTYNSPLLPRLGPRARSHQPKPSNSKNNQYRIDTLAFVAALLLAPLIPAIVTAPFLIPQNALSLIAYIPLMALYIGGLPYLILGTPALIWVMPRKGAQSGPIVETALLVVLVALGVAALIGALVEPDILFAVFFFGLFSLGFAALWAGLFAGLYRKFERQDWRDRNGNV